MWPEVRQLTRSRLVVARWSDMDGAGDGEAGKNPVKGLRARIGDGVEDADVAASQWSAVGPRC